MNTHTEFDNSFGRTDLLRMEGEENRFPGGSNLSRALACLSLATFLLWSGQALAFFIQCPGDTDGDAVVDVPDPGRQVNCMHLSAGDGYTKMSDGRDQYIFGFHDLTGTPLVDVMDARLQMNWPAPTIAVDEGDEFYLNLSNVGMAIRPDLFDPHSVHWHGFSQASAIYDGLPESGVAVNMFSTLAYYYNVRDPGTFMYHCHVEAVEHMQMGMLGSLYVRPAQNRLPDGTDLSGHTHSNTDWNVVANLDDPLVGDKYVYNDGDGSTLYDIEIPLQMGGFDPNFHDANEAVAPLPFANLNDTYTMLNGRGYPDTVNTNPADILNKDGFRSQNMDSLIQATAGQKILIRLSTLNITHFWSLTVLGIPMTVVGRDAALLRKEGSTENLSYATSSVTLGGGQSMDIILDTTGIPAGTYPLYTTNLYNLSNPTEDFGGMMTEIVITE